MFRINHRIVPCLQIARRLNIPSSLGRSLVNGLRLADCVLTLTIFFVMSVLVEHNFAADGASSASPTPNRAFNQHSR
jgi:hypothetical protein